MQYVEAVANESGFAEADPDECGGFFDLLGVVGCPNLVPLDEMHDGHSVGEAGAFEMHFHVTPLSRMCWPGT